MTALLLAIGFVAGFSVAVVCLVAAVWTLVSRG